MENTYESPEFAPINNGVALGPIAVNYLSKTAKWAKFLSILGFIFAGIIVFIALFIGSIFAMMARLNPMASIIPASIGTFISITYVIIAAVVFVLHLFLFQFASRTQKALSYQDSNLMDSGIHRLQSFFKMLGIIMIVYLILIALGILGVISTLSALPHYN